MEEERIRTYKGSEIDIVLVCVCVSTEKMMG